MRHSGAAEQRLWLGPDRYRRSCGHAIANSNAKSYANSNGYAFRMRPYGFADADTYSRRLSIHVYERQRSDCSRDDRHG